MDKDSKQGFAALTGGNGMIAMLLVAVGVFALRDRPLEGTRPASDEPRIEQRHGEQDVDARLWQDPFGAVVRARDAALRKAAGNPAALREAERRSDAALREALAAAVPTSVTVLSVMLPGGPYAENVEARRRTRYAVLGGLNASGYTPEDTEHLGYHVPAAGGESPPPLPEVVPYEWFESNPPPDRARADGQRDHVLVLWVDDSAFRRQPLARLKQLFSGVSAGADARVRWQVIGPFGSDGLRAMVDEVRSKDFVPGIFQDMDVHFHSPFATVSDRFVLDTPSRASGPAQTVETVLKERKVSFARSTGDDQGLAKALIGELVLRGIVVRNLSRVLDAAREAERTTGSTTFAYRELCNVKAQRPDGPLHIALLAEWDTLYGRSLRREFVFGSANPQAFCVDRYHYVRGLDGQLPEQGAAAGASDAAAKPARTAKPADRSADGAWVERAEGQSQFDYLRRLAQRLHERDAELRSTNVDGAGLRAIGILGNDVHDKLLILKALQPEFPDAVFFTTDLDARFLHPAEQATARNLLVASNFGLRLDDGLQRGMPPFRDSYQTAVFFTTQLVLAEVRKKQEAREKRDKEAQPPLPGGFTADAIPQARLDAWFDTPRIFEIGRTRAFDFSAAADSPMVDGESSCRRTDLLACSDIHPPGTPRYPFISPTAVGMALSSLLFLVWFPALCLSRPLRRRVRRFIARGGSPERRRRRRLGLVAGVLVVQLALPVLLAPQWPAFADWLTRNGKPITFNEGISIWPTEAIHLLTLLLCVYLVFRGWNALAHNLDEITLELHLGRTRRQLVGEQDREDRHLTLRQRLANMFSLRRLHVPASGPSGPLTSDPRMTPGTLTFWKFYIVQNRTASRFARCIACVAVLGGAALLLLYAVHQWPVVPQRGIISARVHLVLALATVVMMNFLVFCVADATLFCVRFIGDLRAHRANWPERAIHHFESRLGALPPAVLDHWIDLQFVARRTRCVTGLIYYPFIVLSLLLLSRSPVFDDWHMPVAVALMALFSVAVVLGCAVALRRAAEASRRHAVRDVEDALLRASGRGMAEGPSPAQLSLLLRQIEDLRVGAFAPFSQQPLLKAVLLPFATLGGTTLLDYMALANI